MKRIWLAAALSGLAVHAGLCSDEGLTAGHAMQISRIDLSGITLSVTPETIDRVEYSDETGRFERMEIPGEGYLSEPGRPLLPAVTRWVIVPGDKALELVVTASEPRRESAKLPHFLALNEDGSAAAAVPPDLRTNGPYPADLAVMSEPIVMRGVRMVSVTTYPVQYDANSEEYLIRDRIDTEIRFTEGEPVNPVFLSQRTHRSATFLKMIRELALNGDDVGRDDPDRDHRPAYVGHYIIVVPDGLVRYAAPFIEWRRKSGYKVEILAVPQNREQDGNWIKGEIQTRYNGYLRNGVDPFDFVMIVGDHQGVPNEAGRMIANPNYDWDYACLEGNDQMADVGIARWLAGNESMINLNSTRTLLYEATPRFDNPNWMNKGVVFSQRWSGTWHPSVHTNVRFLVQHFRQRGMEAAFYEDMQNTDQSGANVSNFLYQQFNAGASVIAGRAQMASFRINNVNPNDIFPVMFNFAGHQQNITWLALRTYVNNRAVGPVAATNVYENQMTYLNNLMWIEAVNGHLLKDLPFGWTRVYVMLGASQYLGNNFGSIQTVNVRTCYYGDPGLQSWFGVPRRIEAEVEGVVNTAMRRLDLRVTDVQNDDPVAGAQVTVYAPGDMPAYDSNDYPAYNGMQWWTMGTDEDGYARFVFDNDVTFVPNTNVFYTVTGRTIKPLFSDAVLRAPTTGLVVRNHAFAELEGNGDGEPNPGEVHALDLTVMNVGNRALEDIVLHLSTDSPYVTAVVDEVRIGSIEARGEVQVEGARIAIQPGCPDGATRPITRPVVNLRFESGNSSWASAITLTPRAPNLELLRVVGGEVVVDTVFNLNLEIRNIGSVPTGPLRGQVRTLAGGISLITPNVTFSAIEPGDTARISGDLPMLAGSRVVPPGFVNAMELILFDDNDFRDTLDFTLRIATPRSSDVPLGPDAYGYICFDDTDQRWDSAPDYDWIEIDLREDGRRFDGRRIDYSNQEFADIGEAALVQLPFDLTFYGERYDRITVVTNGYITVGDQRPSVNFLNWPMERAIGAGAGVIAPLWDWLDLAQNGRVYTFFDEDQGRFIVEWARMNYYQNNQIELTFQVVLYDPEVWTTPTGDSQILFQYRNFTAAQGNSDNPYASVGISSPDGTTGIGYSYGNSYPTAATPIAARRALLFQASPSFRQGIVYGYVTDHATGTPVPDAVVFTGHGFASITDEAGFYRINPALAEAPFRIIAKKQGYNDSTYTDQRVAEGDSIQIDFDLLHPEIMPSQANFWWRMDSGMVHQIPFSIFNAGNGSLTWSAEKRLPGDANARPWEFRRSYDVGARTRDDRIEGVVFAQEKFYCAGASNLAGQDTTNYIWVFDREGALIDTLTQPGRSTYGMKNLAWDGNWLWGGQSTGDANVYAIHPETGEELRRWSGPFNPNTGVVWDNSEGRLWVCSQSSASIVAYDIDGNRLGPTLNKRPFRIAGMAWWPEDPDGFPLYFIHSAGLNDDRVYKMNPTTGDTMYVTNVLPQNATGALGAYIINTFDIYSWVFMVVANVPRDLGGDRIDIYQLDGRKDWIDLDVWSGVLEPMSAQEFVLTLNSDELPDTLFEGEIFFRHNASGGQLQLPITLDVIGEMAPEPFDLVVPENGSRFRALPYLDDTLRVPAIRFGWLPSFDWNHDQAITYRLSLYAGGDSVVTWSADTTKVLLLDTLGLPFELNVPIEWVVMAHSANEFTPSNQRFAFVV
ncbi:MAG: hypothetical protein FJY67_11150, partial [Calditrichaeota bacterium]|nr:hypothetical protein [Calditrichota bacterium]